MISWILHEIGHHDVVLGARDWPTYADMPNAVTGQFYAAFGRENSKMKKNSHSMNCVPAAKVLADCSGNDVNLLTGGPLTNIAAALEKFPNCSFRKWVAQGGFAGKGVVAHDNQLQKFRGLTTCPTTNFGIDPDAALTCLESDRLGCKIMVGKNVCHDPRASYNLGFQERLAAAISGCSNGGPSMQSRHRARALGLMQRAMISYGKQKQLHDPLALAVCVDACVADLTEVRPFCQRRTKSDRGRGVEWGATLEPGSGIWAAVAFDESRFHTTVLGLAGAVGDLDGMGAIQTPETTETEMKELLEPMLAKLVTPARLQSHLRSHFDAAVDINSRENMRALLRSFRSSLIVELSAPMQQHDEARLALLNAIPGSLPAQMVSSLAIAAPSFCRLGAHLSLDLRACQRITR